MAVLVTGGGGFVGLNLVEALLARGEEVVLFDNGALPAPAQRMLSRHGRQLNIAPADVRDAAQVNQVFESHRIDYIAHCAAMTSGAERERRDPATIVDINLEGPPERRQFPLNLWGSNSPVSYMCARRQAKLATRRGDGAGVDLTNLKLTDDGLVEVFPALVDTHRY